MKHLLKIGAFLKIRLIRSIRLIDRILFPLKHLSPKNRKIAIISAFFVIVVMIPIIFYTLSHLGKASAAWFDTNFSFRQRVDITNSSGGTLTNQRVKITLDTATLITAGKMKSNCDDIRVTDSNGKLLNHWDTGCNTSTTYIYVKTLSLFTSGSTLYLYYGNPSAANVEKTLGTANNPGTSCKMMKSQGSVTTDGIYYIVPGGNDSDKIQVYCDVTTLSEGWTLVLQNNSAITTNPEPVWTDAVNSVNTTGTFGNTLTAFDLILGLKHWDYIGSTSMIQVGSAPSSINKRATYSSISLDAGNNYALSLGTETLYLGADTSGFKNYSAANNYQFSTSDADHDVYAGNCAPTYGGSPWWYGACWSGSFWGGGDSGSYQNASFWVGSTSDYYNYGAIYIGGTDTMKNTTAASPTSEENGPAPVAYWKFDEGTGTSAGDSSGNGYNGILNGATLPVWKDKDQCISGKCLYFNGSTSGVDTGHDFSWASTSPYSLSVWVQPTTTTGDHPILGKTSYEYTLMQDDTVFRFTYWSNAGSGLTGLASTTTITPGKWYHIEVTSDGSTAKMYVNGNLESTDSNLSGTNQDRAESLKIGYAYSNNGDGAGTHYFPGAIDDVKIYNYGRSEAQVQADFARGGNVLGATANQNLSNGLVGYWKMDESSGNATDSSGNSGTGTATGTTNVAGKYGNAKNFGGTSADRITVTDSAPLSASQITVSEWVNITATTGNWQILMWKGTDYELSLNNGLYFRFGTTTGARVTCDITGTTITTGTWYHVAFTYDGSKIQGYLNGSPIGSSCAQTGNITDTASSVIMSDASYPVNGKIDDARVYNRALSPAEISQLYNFAPGPILYYNLEEGAGTSANDTSGNSITGTWGGTTGSQWTSGKYGKGGNFNGTNSKITTSTSTSLAMVAGQTYEAWIYPTTVSGSRNIIDNVNTWDSRLYQSGTGLTMQVSLDDGNTGYHSASSVIPTANQWYHVAGTFDGSVLTMYVNGSQVYRAAHSGSIVTPGSSLVIGSYGTGEYFQGKIDEVRVYNYARTSGQIVSDMNAGHPLGGSPVGSQLGYWKLDEGYGTNTNNFGNLGSAINGTLTSNPTWTNNGKFGKALIFDGTNDVEASDNTAFDLTQDGFTYSAWINPSNFSNPYNMFMGHYLPYFNVNSSRVLHMSMGAAGSQRSVYGTTTLNANQWYYVTATYDQQGYMKVYLNGKLDGTAGPFLVPTNYASNMYIGQWSSAGTYRFAGLIDEVKVYSGALTADEIKLDYNHGASQVMGAMSDTSGLTGGNVASNSASAEYCVPGDTTSCAPPVLEWKMEERTGTSVNDTSGNGWTGTFVSSPAWISGKIGSGIRFNGSSTISNASFNGSTINTISTWFKPTSTITSATSCQTLIYLRDGGAGDYFLVELGDCTGNITGETLVITHDSGSGRTGMTANISAAWHHLEIVWNSTSSKYDIYLDNQLQTTTSGDTSHAAQLTDPNRTRIGGRDASVYYSGDIDQFRLFNYSRSAAQLAWDYNQGKPVGHWKMDECQGGTANDSSGNGNSGTITIGASGTQTAIGTCTTASTAWGNGATGKYNASLNFDGTDDYASAASLSNIPSGQGARTISTWVKPSNVNPGGVILALNNAAGSSQSFIVQVAQISGTTYLFTDGINGGNNITISGSEIPSASQWSHIAFVFNGSSTWTYYLNGVQKKTGTFGTTINTVLNNISIGRRGDGANTGYYFPGQIDDARVYNYALTKQQVQQVYNQGGAVRYGPLTGSP